MNELAEICRTLKRDFSPKIKDTTKPVRYWSEQDVLDEKVVDAFVIILRTRGCSWALNSGCTMCGYFNDSIWGNVSEDDLYTQFDKVVNHYNGEKVVKIFTSGSFLDEKEVKPTVRKKILQRLAETADKISVESRPEYISNEKLKRMKSVLSSTTLEISIGLETWNDNVRSHAINKGFTFNDYKNAVELVKKTNCKLKTYVLIKPPFLTEKESLEDCLTTIDKIKEYTDTISFNPTNVQRRTLVEYLWKRRQYRPAWLWTIIEILKASKQKAPLVNSKCDIVGGGTHRGAHNCGKCDQSFIESIKIFSISQKMSVFNDLQCSCKETWLDHLDIEHLGFGSLTDISRI